ncbi:MAG: type III pantothenate kinase [Ruminococcaceae bacterium]|nr:type III pantothenate kinase [Oscillospiraceae bacterium]
MILTLDIGNASISVCCVENGARMRRFQLSTDKSRTTDEYTALLGLLAQGDGVQLSRCSGAIIASVVPQLTAVLAPAVQRCTGHRPLIVGPGVKSGLNIRMDDPTELGGDLVAAAVAASERYPLPCILVDMGTATAVGVLDEKGCYVGGLLCPGVSMSQSSLARDASQLPDVSLEKPKRIIGKNTRESMRSGIIHGCAAMVDGVLDRVEAEMGRPAASVVATGENAAVIVPNCRRSGITLDEDLVMYGLWCIWRRNRDAT